jgi:hypothetical protein
MTSHRLGTISWGAKTLRLISLLPGPGSCGDWAAGGDRATSRGLGEVGGADQPVTRRANSVTWAIIRYITAYVGDNEVSLRSWVKA